MEKGKNWSATLTRLWKKRSVTITAEDPSYRVVYLGNVVTGWAKGEGCADKPLSTLWKNYCQSTKPDIRMKMTVTTSGLKAVTKEHGLTEYWSNRITYCASHPSYPKVFCWVYRHEGRRLKPELRCHAVLCSSDSKAKLMERQLKDRLHQALVEFRKEKVLRQNSRLSIVNCVYDNPMLPRRTMFLATGGHNYKPPLERSKSAPKLGAIEEDLEEEEGFEESSETSSVLASESTSIASEECDDVNLMLPSNGDCNVYRLTSLDLNDDLTTSLDLNLADELTFNQKLSLSEELTLDPLRGELTLTPIHECNEEDDLLSDLSDELSPRSRSKRETKEAVEEDNISDESGYSEEKDVIIKV